LLIDAHSKNGITVIYNGRNPDKDGEPDDRTTPNYWLDFDGGWFEVGLKQCGCNKDITLENITGVFKTANKSRRQGILDELNKTYSINGESKKLYEIFELETCQKRAHFFAQTYVESLSNLSGAFNGESLNYSIKALVSGYPFASFLKDKYKKEAYKIGRGPYTYYIDVKVIDKKTKKEVIVKKVVNIPASQKADQKAIANIAYDDANRSKNYKLGNTQVGDGWKFRGRGLLQITGRANYTNSQKIIDEKLLSSEVNLSNGLDTFTAKEAVFAGLADWYEKKCYIQAELGIKPEHVDNVTRKINKATKSYNDRKNAFKTTKKVFELDKCQTIKK